MKNVKIGESDMATKLRVSRIEDIEAVWMDKDTYLEYNRKEC